MIRLAELKARFAAEGIAGQTIELDCVLGWLLLTLCEVPILGRTSVFKGGTALQTISMPERRCSRR